VGGAVAIAIPLLEHTDDDGELRVAHSTRRVFDIEPGSPPIAFFRPALAAFADLEEKDPDLDESAIAKFPLDIAIGAECFAENLAFDAGFLPCLAGGSLAIPKTLGPPAFRDDPAACVPRCDKQDFDSAILGETERQGSHLPPSVHQELLILLPRSKTILQFRFMRSISYDRLFDMAAVNLN
jgi:hypothetical protein